MPDQVIKHKLTAIFYADVVGYSRLSGEDETGAHRRVMAALDSVAESIKTGGGTVLNSAGDALLAEFSSVVAALNTAAHLQTELTAHNADIPDTKRVQFRVGVILGGVGSFLERRS